MLSVSSKDLACNVENGFKWDIHFELMCSVFLFSFLQERIQTLESQLEESRKKQLQYEALRQEKSRLASQLVAQESVIEGLKAERKLWSQELAQQGASLRVRVASLVIRCLLVESAVEVLEADWSCSLLSLVGSMVCIMPDLSKVKVSSV